jgi:hypothetical protein
VLVLLLLLGVELEALLRLVLPILAYTLVGALIALWVFRKA